MKRYPNGNDDISPLSLKEASIQHSEKLAKNIVQELMEEFKRNFEKSANETETKERGQHSSDLKN